jgi:tetratricopeptide (TPR) repeat protein
LLAIAKVYYDNGMTESGDDFVAKAEKIGKKVPRSVALVWMFKGDRKKETDVGAAAGDYDQAILFDPQYLIPYIRYAQVYVDIISQQPQSFSVVQEKLDAVLEAEPNNVIAKQYKARAYYNIIQYDKAIEIYKEIFDPELSSMSELTDYAASLFFIGQYEEATNLMNKGIAKDPTHFVLNRVLMYGALEKANAEVEYIKQAAAEERVARRQNDSLKLITITSKKIAHEHAAKAFYEEGIAAAQHFFSLPKGTNKYIVRDYVTYGNLLASIDQIDSADVQYAKALELGKYEEDLDTYEKIVATLDALGEAVKTAEYYKQSVEMKKTFDDALSGGEYFKLGQYFYSAAKSLTRDPAVAAANAERIDAYLNAADSAFATVVELMPDNILNFMSRARTMALRDPNTETGVARPL